LIFGLRLQPFFGSFLIVCLKEKNMNKAELVEKIADEAELSKASAERALKARVGRNPKTGEAIKIAASKTAKFSAGKAFKDSVNKRK